MISGDVHQARLYAQIYNSLCQYFIQGWCNCSQRKLHTSNKTRFSFIALKNVIHHFIPNYCCISLYSVDKKLFCVQFKLSLWYKIFFSAGDWRGVTQWNNIFNPWQLHRNYSINIYIQQLASATLHVRVMVLIQCVCQSAVDI